MRTAVTLLIVLAATGAAGVAAAQAPSPTPPPVLSESQRAALQRRDRLRQESRELSREGKFTAALAAAQEALAVAREAFGEDDEHVAEALDGLADRYLELDDLDAARKATEQALAIRRKLFGQTHWRTLGNRADLEALDRLGRTDAATRAQMRELERRCHAAADGEHLAEAITLAGQLDDLQSRILGEDHPWRAPTLYDLGIWHQLQEHPQEAAACYRKALALFAARGLDACRSAAFVTARLAMAHSDQGSEAEAKPLFERALEIVVQAVGEGHASTAEIATVAADFYRDHGQPAEAIALYERALRIRKEVFPGQQQDYATRLDQLGALCRGNRQFAKAEPLLREALQIRKRLLGDKHPDYVASLISWAKFYFEQCEYRQAEPFYREAAEKTKAIVGEDHELYAAVLVELGDTYRFLEEYAKAEPLYRQVVQIRRKVLGAQHPDYAVSLSNLALLYDEQEEFAKSEPLYREALEVIRRAVGEKSAAYAATLCNLGNHYAHQGDFSRAEPALGRSLEIRREVLGKNHRDCAVSLHALAALYRDQAQLSGDERQFRQAEALLLEAKDILAKTRGQNHPFYATVINDLALVCGNNAEAEALYRQSLEIDKQLLGDRAPQYAASLHNLAWVLEAQGKFTEAERLYQQALQLHQAALGEDYPRCAVTLSNLGLMYGQQGDGPRAESFHRQAVAIVRRHMESMAVAQSERQQLAMLRLFRHYLDCYLSLAVQSGQFTEPVYREALAWKGIVLQRQRQARAVADRAELLPVFRQLQQVTLRLAHLARATPDPQDESNWREEVDRLTANKERLEAELSARSAAYRQARRQVTVEELRAALPEDVVLVDFWEYLSVQRVAVPQRAGLGVILEQSPDGTKIVRLTPGGAAARDGRLHAGDLIVGVRDTAGKRTATAGRELKEVIDLIKGEAGTPLALQVRQAEDSELREIAVTRVLLPSQRTWEERLEPALAAFVVARNRPVELLPLGPAAPVHEAIEAWRETFGMSAQGAAAGALLRQRLWEPVEARLAGAKIVLVSPDGALGRLPLGALPGKQPGTYLLEEQGIALIPVPQLIPELISELGRKQLEKNLLLLGDVDYDAQPGQPPETPRRKLFGRQTAPHRGDAQHFESLHTGAEIAAIERLYDQEFQTEQDRLTRLDCATATKAAFWQAAPQHRYVHVATHGFFQEESPSPAPVPGSEMGARTERLAGPSDVCRWFSGLASGLALAGANRPATGPGAEADDGILTAEEISTMNLDGVELVVLSACETGLGRSAGGEGLLGLQRAFQTAGARSVVASLWNVPDNDTQVLMGLFYENHWKKNLSALEALRAAQLEMLRASRSRNLLPPEADPRDTSRASPVSWAAFVFSGDWR